MTALPLVVHVVRSLEVGGLENGVVNLVNGAVAGLRHIIVCMTRDGALHSRLPPAVEVVSLGKAPGRDVRTLLRLVALLRRLRPAVVHSRNWTTFDAIPAARLARVPVVVHGEHGREVVDPDGRDPRRNRLRRVFAPLVSRFIAVSDDLRRWLVEDVRIPPRKVLTIHNGVDTSRFVPSADTSARATLGLGDGPVIGTVGRLDPVKDQTGLIRAFDRLRAEYPAATLVIVGDGPCKDDLRAEIVSRGLEPHVRLLGERHDVDQLLRAMDVFVLPSIAEGISNTVLEAMATGLPIVATRVGGNPELVQEGVNGLLVPRQDPAALATAIGTYLGDPNLRAVHGKASRQRAAERFSLERMCNAYATVYADLMTRAGLREA